jgi:hypothetical protein
LRDPEIRRQILAEKTSEGATVRAVRIVRTISKRNGLKKSFGHLEQLLASPHLFQNEHNKKEREE